MLMQFKVTWTEQMTIFSIHHQFQSPRLVQLWTTHLATCTPWIATHLTTAMWCRGRSRGLCRFHTEKASTHRLLIFLTHYLICGSKSFSSSTKAPIQSHHIFTIINNNWIAAPTITCIPFHCLWHLHKVNPRPPPSTVNPITTFRCHPFSIFRIGNDEMATTSSREI